MNQYKLEYATGDAMSPSDSNNNNPSTQQFRVQQQSRKKSNFAIAVLVILGCHVVLLGGLLILGCKPEPAEKVVSPEETNVITNLPPVVEAETNVNSDLGSGLTYHESSLTNSSPIPGLEPNLQGSNVLGGGGPAMLQQLGAEPQTTLPPNLGVTNNAAAPVATAAGTEHVVVQGDTFSKIAVKYGVRIKAIEQANPDANSSRLKIGQKLVIPAPVAAAATSSTTAGATGASTATTKVAPGTSVTDSATGKTVYVVASGDNLTKIAKKFGVQIKSLKDENRLAGDQIKVGQRLTIPAKAVGATTSSTNVVLKQLPTGTEPSNVMAPPERIPTASEITNRATVTEL